jgi:hypothetical protein
MAERTIAPGQVFRETYPPNLMWRVVRIVPVGLDDVSHASIERLDDKSVTKLIACRTLSDPRSYRAAATSPGDLEIGVDKSAQPTRRLRPDPSVRARPV